jgi:predicted nucleic acid-binding protein
MHVPALGPYEVANGLVIAARRQRITQADVQTFTVALSRLRLRVSRLDTLDRHTRRQRLGHQARLDGL